MKYKQIDITTLTKESIKKIQMEDLVSDAAARKDKDAYDWLCNIVQANQQANDPRKRKRINSIRMEYLAKFCGYKSSDKKAGFKTKQDKYQILLDSVADVFK